MQGDKVTFPSKTESVGFKLRSEANAIGFLSKGMTMIVYGD